MKKSLYPVPDPIEVNPFGIMVMCFAFALIFFIIGVVTRHYTTLQSVGV